ncbi:MAG: exodeoxyribonuclease III [Proteobacteria bacterium]|nr:exodeoxyribonuclease III [Pseudomonadota bacterium]
MATLRLLSWNVNGLRAVHKKGFLDWLAREKPDMLCLQETKASEEQLPSELRSAAGYTAYFDQAQRKGYSGVALYTRVQPREVRRGLGIERFDTEGRTLALDFDSFVLFNVYFPNGGMSPERLQFKMDFYDAFLDCVEALRKKGRHIVICGDVNTAHNEIDLARPKENQKVTGFLPQERAWIDRLLAAGYIDTFRLFCGESGQYTWWDMKTRARERNVGWRLDYFFVSESLRSSVQSAAIMPDVQGSDHCPVELVVDI